MKCYNDDCNHSHPGHTCHHAGGCFKPKEHVSYKEYRKKKTIRVEIFRYKYILCGLDPNSPAFCFKQRKRKYGLVCSYTDKCAYSVFIRKEGK